MQPNPLTVDLERRTTPGEPDWRRAYDPPLVWSMRQPCGVWFRACAATASIRMRVLTMASCVDERRV